MTKHWRWRLKNRGTNSLKEDKIVYLNGVFNPTSSNIARLPEGVSLNTADGFYLKIPDKVIIEEVIHLVFTAGKPMEKVTGKKIKVVVEAGVSTRLQLVLHHTGSAHPFSHEMEVQINLSEGACVDFYQIEEPGVTGELSTQHQFFLKKHASLDTWIFSAADAISKTTSTVTFEGEHGFFSARGLSLLRGLSQAWHRLMVHHKAGHCISRQYYKSILSDSAKAGFESLVHVHKGAAKSDSQQLNRNLLLSDQAEAKSQPDLRIDNDDVAASHGSATGQLEDHELFYLQSRGLSKAMARLVLVDGFAEEIVSDVHEADLKAHLEKLIHQGVGTMVGAKT